MLAGTPGANATLAGAGPALVAAHQVDHLPWLGYFVRMQRVDIFVDLDEVQYNHHRFQNRNRIVDPSGRVLWLRVPVVGGKRHRQRMSEVEIAPERWQRPWLQTVRHAYGRHPCFQPVFEELAVLVDRPWRRLLDLNRSLRSFLAKWLDLQPPRIRQGELGLTEERGEALLICVSQQLGAHSFLSGPTGRSFLAPAAFGAAGIPLEFDPPFEAKPYPQRGLQTFVPNLSALDLVMNLGPEAAGWLRGTYGRA
jgi:hypothetical protein